MLKDRVTNLDGFLDAVERVAAGGTAMDPEVVRQLFTRSTRRLPGHQVRMPGSAAFSRCRSSATCSSRPAAR